MLDNGLRGKVQPAWVKKKWENLKQKYKVSYRSFVYAFD